MIMNKAACPHQPTCQMVNYKNLQNKPTGYRIGGIFRRVKFLRIGQK